MREGIRIIHHIWIFCNYGNANLWATNGFSSFARTCWGRFSTSPAPIGSECHHSTRWKYGYFPHANGTTLLRQRRIKVNLFYHSFSFICRVLFLHFFLIFVTFLLCSFLFFTLLLLALFTARSHFTSLYFLCLSFYNSKRPRIVMTTCDDRDISTHTHSHTHLSAAE